RVAVLVKLQLPAPEERAPERIAPLSQETPHPSLAREICVERTDFPRRDRKRKKTPVSHVGHPSVFESTGFQPRAFRREPRFGVVSLEPRFSDRGQRSQVFPHAPSPAPKGGEPFRSARGALWRTA